MHYYFAIYGYEITKRIEFDDFILFPVTTKSQEAKKLAQDRNKFYLTAVGEIKNEPNSEYLFDLAGALTFCQQQWVIVSKSYEFPENTDPGKIIENFSTICETTNKRPTQGSIIIEDVFSPDARKNYLDLCISQLRDRAFEGKTNFRKAFFRNVESWRMPNPFIDVTYYYDFSSLEILARSFAQDYDSPVGVVATKFLKHHGFKVDQVNIHSRHLAVQTYAHLRNALFHNGKFEKTVQENGNTVTLKLNDYACYLSRLIPDVLLKVLGYDDNHINWNRWLDRMPFKG